MSKSASQTIRHESLISDFPFIAHDGAVKSRRQIPTLVRAHVMERYHRERRAKKGIKDSGNPVWSQHEFVTPVGQGQILRWEDETTVPKARTGRKKTTSALPPRSKPSSLSRSESMRGVSKNTEETCTKVKEEPEIADTLARVHHYRKTHLSSLIPKDAMEENGSRLIQILNKYYGVVDTLVERTDPWHTFWIPFAFSDPLLFHASLSKFSVHLAATCGATGVNTELLKHKGIAMQQMSKRIADPTLEPTDQTISAVICLIGIEMLNPDRVAFKAHLKGLRQMIAMRGGVGCLEEDGVLIAGYLSYEYVVATMADEFDEEENWPERQGLGVPDPHCLLFPARSGIFTLQRTLVDPVAHGFSEETVVFLSTLCQHLCVSDVFVNRNRPNDEARKSLGALIADLTSCNMETKQELGNSPFSDSNLQSLFREDHVLQALMLTAIIQFPGLSSSPLHNSESTLAQKITKLRYHLSKTSLLTYWRPIPGALLWCMMVGTGTSKDCPERSWFVANMLRLTCGIAFTNLEGMRIALETFNRLSKQQEKIPWASLLF